MRELPRASVDAVCHGDGRAVADNATSTSLRMQTRSHGVAPGELAKRREVSQVTSIAPATKRQMPNSAIATSVTKVSSAPLKRPIE